MKSQKKYFLMALTLFLPPTLSTMNEASGITRATVFWEKNSKNKKPNLDNSLKEYKQLRQNIIKELKTIHKSKSTFNPSGTFNEFNYQILVYELNNLYKSAYPENNAPPFNILDSDSIKNFLHMKAYIQIKIIKDLEKENYILTKNKIELLEFFANIRKTTTFISKFYTINSSSKTQSTAKKIAIKLNEKKHTNNRLDFYNKIDSLVNLKIIDDKDSKKIKTGKKPYLFFFTLDSIFSYSLIKCLKIELDNIITEESFGMYKNELKFGIKLNQYWYNINNWHTIWQSFNKKFLAWAKNLDAKKKN